MIFKAFHDRVLSNKVVGVVIYDAVIMTVDRRTQKQNGIFQFNPAMFWDKGWKVHLLTILFSTILSYIFARIIAPEFATTAILIGFLSSALVSYVVGRVVSTFRHALRDKNKELQLQMIELKRVNALLQISNADLEAFARMVAHDLKNPISGIVGHAELLEAQLERAGILEPFVTERVNSITRSGRKMSSIIESLLLLATIGRKEVAYHPLDMVEIVSAVQERLFVMVNESNVQISFPDRWLPAVGYTPWIEEVWANYISNAIKYGGDPPQIQLGCNQLPDKKMVRFWVKDNGNGISAKGQAQLFTEFTRLSEQKGSGHGIGLSIVRRVVEEQGGVVGVESKEGEGSLFYFTLPNV